MRCFILKQYFCSIDAIVMIIISFFMMGVVFLQAISLEGGIVKNDKAVIHEGCIESSHPGNGTSGNRFSIK